jgi:rod shape-determining protein MreC
MGRAMHDPQNPELVTPNSPSSREGPEVMQAFVASHRPFFIQVAVLLAQLLLLSFQITRSHNVRLIRIWAVAVFDPFERSLKGITDATTHAWRTYGGLLRAQQDNQDLRRELATTRSHLQQVAEQAAESDLLRRLLDFKARAPFQTLAAEIIAFSPGASSNAIVIDKGADYGLTPDLAVITPEGVVGKIIGVFHHSSQVLLITDPLSGVGTMLERSRAQGVLKGAGNNLCQLDYIMNEESVSSGDAVVTSGLDQVYPKGLPVGTVLKVRDSNIYKIILIRPAAALDRLETVLVLKASARQEMARH